MLYNNVITNINAIINAKKAGIFTKVYLIVGLPGENRETVEDTKKFITEAKPDSVSLYTFIPYPGTPIWKDPEKFDMEIIEKDFKNYFIINKDGFGGVVAKPKKIPLEELLRLRKDLLDYLRVFYDKKC